MYGHVAETCEEICIQKLSNNMCPDPLAPSPCPGSLVLLTVVHTRCQAYELLPRFHPEGPDCGGIWLCGVSASRSSGLGQARSIAG